VWVGFIKLILKKMKIEELIEICRNRNDLEFLFSITKQIAESDSIGEGYGYCNEYKRKRFNNAEKHFKSEEYCQWLEYGGIKIYELYLYQIGALVKQNEA
jgi:hypothetical protein